MNIEHPHMKSFVSTHNHPEIHNTTKKSKKTHSHQPSRGCINIHYTQTQKHKNVSMFQTIYKCEIQSFRPPKPKLSAVLID